MEQEQRDRLRAQLKNAQRRLAQLEQQRINVASQSSYSGGWHGGPEDAQGAQGLNQRMASAGGIDEIRAEIVRLRQQLGDDATEGSSLLARLKHLLGR